MLLVGLIQLHGCTYYMQWNLFIRDTKGTQKHAVCYTEVSTIQRLFHTHAYSLPGPTKNSLEYGEFSTIIGEIVLYSMHAPQFYSQ